MKAVSHLGSSSLASRIIIPAVLPSYEGATYTCYTYTPVPLERGQVLIGASGSRPQIRKHVNTFLKLRSGCSHTNTECCLLPVRLFLFGAHMFARSPSGGVSVAVPRQALAVPRLRVHRAQVSQGSRRSFKVPLPPLGLAACCFTASRLAILYNAEKNYNITRSEILGAASATAALVPPLDGIDMKDPEGKECYCRCAVILGGRQARPLSAELCATFTALRVISVTACPNQNYGYTLKSTLSEVV